MNSNPFTLRWVAPIIISLALWGCDATTEPDPNRVATCDDPGTEYRGTTDRAQIWTRAGSPHHIAETVRILHRVTIEPGALVCGSANAQIVVGRLPDQGDPGTLYAVGTAEAPIVFTATNPSTPWGGIRVEFPLCCGLQPDSNRIAYATIEHALVGIAAAFTTYIDNTRIRQIRGNGVFLSLYGGRLAHSVVDSAALDGGVAVAVGLSGGTFEETVVRGSGGDGVVVGSGSGGGRVELLGGRIEGGKRNGLVAWGFRGVNVDRTRPMRITGNAGYPAVVNLNVLYQIWPDIGHQDSLLGNGWDTVVVYPATAPPGPPEILIRPRLPWILRANEIAATTTRPTGQLLYLEPGASVTFQSVHTFSGGRILARGTAEAPVTIRGTGDAGLRLSGFPGDSSFITHARLFGIRLGSDEAHPLVLDNVTADSTSVELRSPGSRISSSTFERGPPPGIAGFGVSGPPFAPVPAIVVLGAPRTRLDNTRVSASVRVGIQIEASDVAVTGCKVRMSALDGIRVLASAAAVQIHCNLELNGGAGVSNLGTAVVSATDNWWGDPAGPTGANGDGVSGPVQYIPFRPTAFP
jgi:hypothetical protein